ncbi:MAG: site-specific DNA-methyltransferase [Saprospiraceae bacterium]
MSETFPVASGAKQVTTHVVVNADSNSLPFPSGMFQTAVTSPPYYGARLYMDGGDEHGREKTPDKYVSALVHILKETARCLKPDGTLFLNIADNYAGLGGQHGKSSVIGRKMQGTQMRAGKPPGFRYKDLFGIPWRVAFALQGNAVVPVKTLVELCRAIDSRDLPALDALRAGFRLHEELESMFYVRSNIAWVKGFQDKGFVAQGANEPESVTDRPTSAWEYVFLLAKQKRYYFNQEAVRTTTGGNVRDVFFLKTAAQDKAYPSNHPAPMPLSLARACILMGSRDGDWVLDPFGGSGTTSFAARSVGRNSAISELNADNAREAYEALNNPAYDTGTEAPRGSQGTLF